MFLIIQQLVINLSFVKILDGYEFKDDTRSADFKVWLELHWTMFEVYSFCEWCIGSLYWSHFENFMLCTYTQNMILKISRFSIPLLGFTKIILCSKFEISKIWAAHTAIWNLGGMHYDSDFGGDDVLHFGSIFILAEVYLQNFSMIEVGTFWK